MLYGINYKSNEMHNKGYVVDGKLKTYFTNPISSMKAAEELENLSQGNLVFTVFELEKEKENKVNKSKIVDSYDEYEKKFLEEDGSVLAQKIEDLWLYNQMATFKKYFEGMSEKEQNDFMVKSGLKFKFKEEEQKERE